MRLTARYVWPAGREEGQEHSPDTIYCCCSGWYRLHAKGSSVKNKTTGVQRASSAEGGGRDDMREQEEGLESSWARKIPNTRTPLLTCNVAVQQQ